LAEAFTMMKGSSVKSVLATVVAVSPLQSVGDKVKCDVKIADRSFPQGGTLVFWGEQAESVTAPLAGDADTGSVLALQRGDTIHITNVYVSTYDFRKYLSVGRSSVTRKVDRDLATTDALA
jgi:hypothetical protein